MITILLSLSPPTIYGQQLELVETYQISLSSLTIESSSIATFDSGGGTLQFNAQYFGLETTSSGIVQSVNSGLQVSGMDSLLVITSVNMSGLSYYYTFTALVKANNSTSPRALNICGSGNTNTIIFVSQEGGSGTPAPELPQYPPPSDLPQNEPDNDIAPVVSQDSEILDYWVKTRTYTSSQGNYIEDITYYNGLGLPKQHIQVGAASNSGRNIVTPLMYDAMLRSNTREYLPYVSASNSTAVQDSQPVSAQADYYKSVFSVDEDAPYIKNIAEVSSSRILKSTLQGHILHNSGKGTSTQYLINGNNEVPLLTVNGDNVTFGGHYPAGTLYKNTVVSPDNITSTTYTDKSGNVVMQKVQNQGLSILNTLYAYDKYGLLRYVITPSASEFLLQGTTLTPSSAMTLQQCYHYQYDGNGNMIYKQQPGRDAQLYVYDKGGREVMYQDGNMRSDGYWLCTQYDEADRITLRGIVQSSLSAVQLRQRNSFLYSDFTPIKILEENRYYGMTTGSNFTVPSFETNAISGTNDLSITANRGLVQGRNVLVMKNGTEYYIQEGYYYDKHGRVIQYVAQYPNGTYRMSSKYGYRGELLQQLESFGNDALLISYTYDNRGRMTGGTAVLNNTYTASFTNSYDDLGKLTGVTYGNGVSQTYQYTIQGWQTISQATLNGNNIYSQELRYYNPALGAAALYGGNISEWSTRQGTDAQSTYLMEYDNTGRLTGTMRHHNSLTTDFTYTERGISYDANGNIVTLKRYAQSGTTPQNNLSYTYIGNKLSSINDLSGGGTSTFSYDANGNMTSHGQRGLQLSYNFINLPSVVSGTLGAVTYSFSADGTKVAVEDNSGNGYQYMGSLIYAKSGSTLTLESARFAHGYIAPQDGQVYYHTTDHLGSVRAITNLQGSVVERNGYYPFGSETALGSSYPKLLDNRMKFNGKEVQTTGNLGLLDYGARMYDPAIGRWTAQDPLGEEMYNLTPYRFSLNNPISVIDFMGLSDYFNFNGQYLGSDGSTDDLIRIISDDNWENVQTIDKDGNVNVNIEAALKLSSFFSDASMNKDAILNVYNHYNLTGLELKERDDYNNEDIKAGMTFSIQYNKKTNKYTPCIKIPIELNRDSDIYNHYWNIVNSFEHEKQHYRDFKVWGIEKYKSHSESEKEKRAISYQYNHYSYQYTTVEFQRGIKAYWKSKK